MGKVPSNPFDLVPPSDVQSELDVIGCCVSDPSVYAVALRYMGADDCYDETCRLAFAAFGRAISAAGKRMVTKLDLAEYVSRNGCGDKVTPKWMLACEDRIADASNVAYYAQRVRVAADKRRQMDAAGRMLYELAHGGDGSAAKRALDLAMQPPPWERPADVIRMTKMSEIQEKPINWVWKWRLACGLNMLGGMSGAGKSLIMCDLAARISRGHQWPRIHDVDTDETIQNEVGNVAFLCLEAGAGDEIKPRLRVAGADMDRVVMLDAHPTIDGERRTINLVTDMDRIKREAHERLPGGLRMLVIDPIGDFLPGVRVNYDEELRPALHPLMTFAQENSVAVVMIIHDNKRTDTAAQDKTAGGKGFVAMSRSAWRVDVDRSQPPTKRLTMLPVKANYMPKDFGLGAAIKPCETDMEYPVLHWDAEPVTKSADEVLAEKMKPKRDHKASEAGDVAMGYLNEHGPTVASVLMEYCKENGHSAATVQRGMKKLDCEVKKIGKVWVWKTKAQAWPAEEANLLNQPKDF